MLQEEAGQKTSRVQKESDASPQLKGKRTLTDRSSTQTLNLQLDLTQDASKVPWNHAMDTLTVEHKNCPPDRLESTQDLNLKLTSQVSQRTAKSAPRSMPLAKTADDVSNVATQDLKPQVDCSERSQQVNQMKEINSPNETLNLRLDSSCDDGDSTFESRERQGKHNSETKSTIKEQSCFISDMQRAFRERPERSEESEKHQKLKRTETPGKSDKRKRNDNSAKQIVGRKENSSEEQILGIHQQSDATSCDNVWLRATKKVEMQTPVNESDGRTVATDSCRKPPADAKRKRSRVESRKDVTPKRSKRLFDPQGAQSV